MSPSWAIDKSRGDTCLLGPRNQRLTAAAGTSAAAPAAGGRLAGRTAGREATYRDRGQELDRIVVTLRAGAGRRGLCHRAFQLERVTKRGSGTHSVARQQSYPLARWRPRSAAAA